jgi:hypothetical protein
VPAKYPLTKRASFVFARQSLPNGPIADGCAGMKHVLFLRLRCLLKCRFRNRIESWKAGKPEGGYSFWSCGFLASQLSSRFNRFVLLSFGIGF